jgi:hypothetical protein
MRKRRGSLFFDLCEEEALAGKGMNRRRELVGEVGVPG